MNDRAERSTGFLPFVGAAIARWRADDPVPPPAWTPPRGLGELNVLLDQVRAAGRGDVLPPIVRDDAGFSIMPGREWATRAGLRPAVGVLAVLLASESEPIDKYPQYAWAIGEAVVNATRAIQRKDEAFEDALVRRVVGDHRLQADGRFARQGGRWASTAQAPDRRHVACADLLLQRVREGAPAILAHGATQWTDQRTQHNVHTAAVKSGDAEKARRNPPPEVLMRSRYLAGARWVGPLVDVLGEVIIDPYLLTLLGPAGRDEGEAMAMLADGRRRWNQPA